MCKRKKEKKMKKTLYFNKNGYCMSRPSSKTVFQMKCLLPKGFISKGVAIEDFITDPSFKIKNGHHTKEAWLYKNKKALASVKRGLAQAKARNFSKRPPNLAEFV